MSELGDGTRKKADQEMEEHEDEVTAPVSSVSLGPEPETSLLAKDRKVTEEPVILQGGPQSQLPWKGVCSGVVEPKVPVCCGLGLYRQDVLLFPNLLMAQPLYASLILLL